MNAYDRSSLTSPVKAREIFGWSMYDFANSSYATVIITAVYGNFFTEFIVPASSTTKNSYWSAAIFISNMIALILAPFIGAVCDLSGNKKRYLLVTTVFCAAFTSLLATVGPGDIAAAVLFVSLSNAAFLLSETLSGSFLTDLSTKENMGKISGIGWAIGYFGGLASLAMIQAVVHSTPESDFSSFVSQNQIAMVYTGLFFLVASLPTFLLVKNRSVPAPGFENASFTTLFKAGFDKFAHTWQLLKQNPVLFRFFRAFAIYMAGLNIVVTFVGIYARGELGFSTTDLVQMFLILQLSAAFGALAFGFAEDKIGAKATVLSTLVMWVSAVLAIFYLDSLAATLGYSQKTLFFAISLFAGMAVGATQTSSRAIVGMLAPAEHSAQIFGYWGAFLRVASFLGISFGILSDVLSSRRLALLIVVVFFSVGGFLVARCPLPSKKGVKNSATS